MLVSGAPERIQNHANEILEVAHDILKLMMKFKNPVTKKHILIRIGNFFFTILFCPQSMFVNRLSHWTSSIWCRRNSNASLLLIW